MKTLSIGREHGCDIVINDNTDVISRRHAILNISSTGKITIVDKSRNGTYVNGMRIARDVPVPITRSDIISFAHVSKLDWNLVPKNNNVMRYGILTLIGGLLVICGYFAFIHLTSHPQETSNKGVNVVDSLALKKDSIKKVQDSIAFAKQEAERIEAERQKFEKDSIEAVKKKRKEYKKGKNETKPIVPKDTIKKNRPIG